MFVNHRLCLVVLLSRLVALHEQGQIDPGQRMLQRLEMVPDEQIERLQAVMAQVGVDTVGVESVLRYFLAQVTRETRVEG